MSQPTRDPLAAVLDTLIPPSADGRMPGAGRLGLASAVRAKVAGMEDAVAWGLAAADAGARERGAADFAALPLEDRVAVLRELEPREPGFLGLLVFHTFTLYYQQPEVLPGLGLEPRPPHPKGYALEPGDLAGLERVRARGRRYREA